MTDPLATARVSMHLDAGRYPPNFSLTDESGSSLGSVRTPLLPTWRQLLRSFAPFTQGRPATYAFADAAGTSLALIERSTAGFSGPGAMISSPAGLPLASCEPHGAIQRSWSILDPGRQLLATVEAGTAVRRLLDSREQPQGEIGYEPPRHGTRSTSGHDTHSFHFSWAPTVPTVVRLGSLAAMVVWLTGTLL